MNYLYYGDNLDNLREYIPEESVDLIYLDPPFKVTRRHREEGGAKRIILATRIYRCTQLVSFYARR
ncbi:hypothetical protein ES703_59398 [subsurface metagenome]